MINPYDFIDELNKTLTSESVVVADSGTAFHICAQALKLPEGARYLTDGAQGAMGAAIPMAIGAALAGAKDVRVVTGDGSFMFQLGAMAEVRGKPIRVYVLCNDGYNTIRNTQQAWCEGREIGLVPWADTLAQVIAQDEWPQLWPEIEFIDIDPAVKTRRPRVNG